MFTSKTMNQHSPKPIFKSLELPSVKNKSKRNKAILESLINTSISISPVISTDLSKIHTRRRIVDSPRDMSTKRTIDTKFDINFSLNPGSIIGYSGDHSEYFVKNSDDRNKNRFILPKLISSEAENGYYKRKISHNQRYGNISDPRNSLNDNFMAQKEAYQKKIKYLEERNRELEEQLREKKAHETEADQSFPLGSDEKGGTSLYKKVNDLRAKNSALKWKIESLEKENKDLKELVKTYRTMIVRVGEAETSILNEHSKSYESDENNTTLAQADNTASSKRIQTLNQLDLTFFDRLNGVFKTFSKHKSLFYTIEASIEEVCKVLDCGYARILLTNQQIKKIYQESGNSTSEKIKAMKIALSSTEVQMIEKKEHTAVDFESLNIVDTLEGLKKSFNNEGKGISCPIYSIENPDEFIGAIQVSEPFQTSNPSKYRRKKGLIKKDEALLEAFSKIVSVLVDIHRRDWCMKETEKKLGIYNESMTKMVSVRSHQELLDAVKTRLSSYFDFEHIGLLFYNEKTEIMYTYDIQKRQDGRYYTHEPLRYPARLGISGQCIKQNIDLVALNEPRKSRHFQPETDNSSGAGTVRNIIIALLKDEKGYKTGILQLINKKEGQPIEEKDENTVRSIQKLIGALISQISDISFAVNLSSTINKTMIKIENTINHIDDEE